MKKTIIILLCLILVACNWFKEKSKESINKSGEIVSKSGSEFLDGVAKGVEKTFQSKVYFSEELLKLKIEAGKIIINSAEKGTDNLLSVYLIFGKTIEKKITIKIFDENNQEYGRTTKFVKGNNGDAKYIDFEFDERTNIEGKGRITFE